MSCNCGNTKALMEKYRGFVTPVKKVDPEKEAIKKLKEREKK